MGDQKKEEKKEENQLALDDPKRRRPIENLKFSKMTRNLRLHKGLTVGRIRDLGLPSQVQTMRLHMLNYAPDGDLRTKRKFLMISGGSSKTQVEIKKIVRVFEP